jgi:hypothetical protein
VRFANSLVASSPAISHQPSAISHQPSATIYQQSKQRPTGRNHWDLPVGTIGYEAASIGYLIEDEKKLLWMCRTIINTVQCYGRTGVLRMYVLQHSVLAERRYSAVSFRMSPICPFPTTGCRVPSVRASS